MAESSKNLATVVVMSAWLVLAQGMGPLGCKDDEGDDHGHGDDDHMHDETAVGPASGAVCPDDSELTYANFGKMFMEDYCTRCHSSELEGDAARMNAPEGHDFDTIKGIWAVQDHIDQLAASGPANTNVKMPLSDPKPTKEEREDLGEWLACEAPE